MGEIQWVKPLSPSPSETLEWARQTLKNNRVAVFLVAYNAEKHIEKVLNRIPDWIAKTVAEIYVIDDHSQDETVKVAGQVPWNPDYAPLRIYRTPYNQGYGGNQRLGYLYAIEKKFDIVVLLHADGQYAPESLPEILAPYSSEQADAVFGSRFIRSGDALRGRMPLYKWVGNRVLTKIQNFLLKSKMSEMHSGYRSYRVSALERVPFQYNSLGFDFDADIIVQFLGAGHKIVEVAIPTFYGDEICHVNGLQYAWNCVKTAAKFRFMQFEIFYDPKFDLKREQNRLSTVKHAKTSIHHHVRSLKFADHAKILDVGGEDAVSRVHADRGHRVVLVNKGNAPLSVSFLEQVKTHLNAPWDQHEEKFDAVLALDVLGHLSFPEKSASEIFSCLRSGGKLYTCAGNIGFWPLRLVHLFGQFNYGRRGILDLRHTRLFTLASFKRLMKNSGFRVDQVLGFGPPLADIDPRSKFLAFLDRLCFRLARAWPTLFAFQIFLVCTRVDSAEELVNQAFPGEIQSRPHSTKQKEVLGTGN